MSNKQNIIIDFPKDEITFPEINLPDFDLFLPAHTVEIPACHFEFPDEEINAERIEIEMSAFARVLLLTIIKKHNQRIEQVRS